MKNAKKSFNSSFMSHTGFQQKTGLKRPFFDFFKNLSEVPKVSILKAYSVGWAASSAGAAAAALASSSACLAAAIRS